VSLTEVKPGATGIQTWTDNTMLMPSKTNEAEKTGRFRFFSVSLQMKARIVSLINSNV
jgi:hypothetical protein